VAFVHIAALVLLSLFVSFCVCLLDVSGSVVLLIFFGFVWGLPDWRLWTAANARWASTDGE